jgi:TetR/AcrR family transcriptional regulator, mexJK operon transcriptional repressor
MWAMTTPRAVDQSDHAGHAPTPSRRRGRPPGSAGRELLAIARAQFLGHGFRRTTMDAIAARAKISKQTLYAQYPSKDALYAAVVRDWVDQGHDALAPHAHALLDCDDLDAGLRRLAEILQGGILSEPVLKMRALVAAEADTLPAVADDYVRRSWERNVQLLADTLAALTRQGRLAADDPSIAAEQFVWLVVGAPLNRLELTAAKHRHTRRHLHQVADQGVRTFLSRYRHPGSP